MRVSCIVAAICLSNAAAQSSLDARTSKSSRGVAGTIVGGIWYTDFSLASRRASEISQFYAIASSIVAVGLATHPDSPVSATYLDPQTSSQSSTMLPGGVETSSADSRTVSNTTMTGSSADTFITSLSTNSSKAVGPSSTSASASSSRNMAARPLGPGARVMAVLAALV